MCTKESVVKFEVFLILSTFFGLLHVGTFLYLKKTGSHNTLYNELKISKWLIALMLLMGFMLGAIYNNNILFDESQFRKTATLILFTFSVPFTIVGFAWIRAMSPVLFRQLLSVFKKG